MNDSVKSFRIRVVIIAGLMVLLMMICFPPFESVLINRDSGVVIRANPSGYRFLFSSPESLGGPFMERVNYGQLGLQVVGWGCLLAIATLAVSALTGRSEKAETPFGADLINGKDSAPKANGLKGKGAAELTEVGEISPRTATSEETGVVLPDALEGPSLPQISEIETNSSTLESPCMDAPDDATESTVTKCRPHYPVYTGPPDPSTPYLVSFLITAAGCFLRAISTYGGASAIVNAIGGMIGSALAGGVVALIVWGLNAEIRGKKDFGSAAKVGWVYAMPILATLSVVVHWCVTPILQREVAEKRVEQASTRSEALGKILQKNRSTLGGGPLPKSAEPVALRNWHVSVITIDLPAQPRSEPVSNASDFKMSSNFIAETEDKAFQVHVAFRRMYSGYPTPEGVWSEKLAQQVQIGDRPRGVSNATQISGHKALRWVGNVGTKEVRALVVTSGHDYCLVRVVGSSRTIGANAERILESVKVVGFAD